MKIIDFHTHTYISDGELGASELIRRAQITGYSAIGITDHCDETTLDNTIKIILKLSETLDDYKIKVIPGVELTHIPVKKIDYLVNKTREMGIPLVIIHGESPVEPVEEGTNRKAIESKVDILAHPGNLSVEEAELAKKNNVFIEITSRGGHSLFNGHIYKLWKKVSMPVVIDSDTHDEYDLMDEERYIKVAMGSGFSKSELDIILNNAEELLERLIKRIH